MDIANMAVRHAPEGFQAETAVNRVVPQLRSQQNEILAEMRTQSRETPEYWQNAREVVQIEARIQDYQNEVIKERGQKMKEANEKAKRDRRELRDVLDMESRLIEERIKNNPFLSPQQAQRAMVPALLNQYREMMVAQPGETYRERLERMTDAERVRGNILEGAGFGRKSWARTLGGGMMFRGDRRFAAQVLGQLDQAAAEAEQMSKQAAAGRPVVFQTVLDPNATVAKQKAEFEKQWDQYEKLITQPIGRIPGME